jgi:chromosome segregation ATPase
VDDAKLLREIAELESELTTLRTDESRGRSTLATLEGKLAEVSTGIAAAQRTAAELEQRLEHARSELADAVAEDAYRQAHDRVDATARELAETIERLLSGLTLYEEARSALTELRSQLAPSIAARIGSHDVPEAEKHEAVAEAWARLSSAVGAVGAPADGDPELNDDLVEAAARSAMGHAIPSLPEHLRGLARRRREEYLSNLARSQREGTSPK